MDEKKNGNGNGTEQQIGQGILTALSRQMSGMDTKCRDLYLERFTSSSNATPLPLTNTFSAPLTSINKIREN